MGAEEGAQPVDTRIGGGQQVTSFVRQEAPRLRCETVGEGGRGGGRHHHVSRAKDMEGRAADGDAGARRSEGAFNLRTVGGVPGDQHDATESGRRRGVGGGGRVVEECRERGGGGGALRESEHSIEGTSCSDDGCSRGRERRSGEGEEEEAAESGSKGCGGSAEVL